LQGCPELPNRSQPLVGRSSPYYEGMWRTYCCSQVFIIIFWRGCGWLRPSDHPSGALPLDWTSLDTPNLAYHFQKRSAAHVAVCPADIPPPQPAALGIHTEVTFDKLLQAYISSPIEDRRLSWPGTQYVDKQTARQNRKALTRARTDHVSNIFLL